MRPAYQTPIDALLQHLQTDPEHGLSQAQVEEHRKRHGRNEIVDSGVKSPWRILYEQFTATMVLILMIAAMVSLFLGDLKDAAAIVVIVILNGVLGFVQEYRAEKAIHALKQISAPHAKVKRDKTVQDVEAWELVPGDIILLEAGSVVPADARLMESVNLQTQESALSGESAPIEKNALALLPPDVPLGDRVNMVFKGTQVTYGRGVAVVTATGMQTELGKVAGLLQTVQQEQTPLQRRLTQLGKGLAGAALALVGIIFSLGMLRGEDFRTMLLTALSMAVAAVPEGLPAVVTIALAIGSQRMLKRKALIRRLPVVETLGSVTVICSDKTGTLTENQMTVTLLDLAGHRVDLTESLRSSGSRIYSEPVLEPIPLPHTEKENKFEPALSLLLIGSALCNDASLQRTQTGNLQAIGDPTEGALVVAAARFGFRKEELEKEVPRVAEMPFDSERKRMTTLHRLRPEQKSLPETITQAGNYIAFTKGAAEGLLALSNALWMVDHLEPVDDVQRARIMKTHDEMASKGMRVLGMAFRTFSLPSNLMPEMTEGIDFETDLVFVGLLGLMDPPRPEAREAVETCKHAGIHPVMITGDHPLTALHIAHELGIVEPSGADGLLTGQQLDRLSLEELEKSVEEIRVYARVTPEHKLKIVQALQDKGQIVAMTGDGVNDAPALKKADIGIAMGVTGTDVSKEAADMVLLDDNFSTIVAAVEEGRTIYDNARKFIKYILTSNSGEIWVMLLAPFLGMPLPLLPLQILWINLVTDGLPGLALAVEPAERNTMQRKPYPPGENVFARGLGKHILWVGFMMGLVPLTLGYLLWNEQNPAWQTMVFNTLTLAQMGHALAIRSHQESLFRLGLFSNKPLLYAVLLTFTLQLMVIYLPMLQPILGTTTLSPELLMLSLGLSSIIFWVVELEKWWIRKREV